MWSGTTLEPIKLHEAGRTASKASSVRVNPNLYARYIGPLPVDIHIQILHHLPIASLPSYALASRALAQLTHDERVWKRKCALLGVREPSVQALLASIDDANKVSSSVMNGAGASGQHGRKLSSAASSSTSFSSVTSSATAVGQAAVLQVEDADDDEFGDFAAAPLAATLQSNLFISPKSPSQSASHRTAQPFGVNGSASAPPVLRMQYIYAHKTLVSLAMRLRVAPHVILSSVFSGITPSPFYQQLSLTSPTAALSLPSSTQSASTVTLRQQASTLALLARFLHPSLQPVLLWYDLRSRLSAAIDRFQAVLLAAFETAVAATNERQALYDETGSSVDRNHPSANVGGGAGDEGRMREAAHASWTVTEAERSERARTHTLEWELGRVWQEKLSVFYETDKWDSDDNFTDTGQLAFEAMDTFMKYVVRVVERHGSVAVRVFPPQSNVLLNFADRVATEIINEYITPLLTKARGVPQQDLFLQATAATFIQACRMSTALKEVAGIHTGEAKEKRVVQTTAVISEAQAEDVIYRMFEEHVDEYLDEEVEFVKKSLETVCSDWNGMKSGDLQSKASAEAQAQFLTSSNPDTVKRTFLASFTEVMLLPVTIVPRMGGVAIGAVGAVGGAAVTGISMLNPTRWVTAAGGGGAEEGEREGYGIGKTRDGVFQEMDMNIHEDGGADKHAFDDEDGPTVVDASSLDVSKSTVSNGSHQDFDSLQLLLSLDVALELIQLDRESLKRLETFAKYPGTYGHRVRETIEEVFICLLTTMSSFHVQPGFARAIEQMQTYEPDLSAGSEKVAPLMQFFELVHIGDMIQSMVQVFFDKEVAQYIDKTDFLNGVVREKKRFENALDESVAAGLNAGTEVLMNQVEHIIQTRAKAREYYPDEGSTMDLKPTWGCREAIACLNAHCQLLKGSTTKEVLEVFHQEIAIRLHSIIQKHLKRQIISQQGGFQVIADLNEYHSFVTSLKIPTIAQDFANLKMLGHVYIVEDATDLAQIVRDVQRYGGSFRPEDIYEFIQRRSDWKQIERTVDKTMYSLSFKEDCIIC